MVNTITKQMTTDSILFLMFSILSFLVFVFLLISV